MRSLLLLALLALGGLTAVGCGGPKDEPAAGTTTPPPPIKQAEPGMLSPEERARQNVEPGAAGDGG